METFAYPEGTREIAGDEYPHGEYSRIVLPEGVKEIGDFAFAWDGAIEEVVFPEGLSSIGEGAFFGCSALKEAVLPASLTHMGQAVFAECAALERAVFGGDGPFIVEDETFRACTALKEVQLPKKLAVLGSNPAFSGAFENCTALERVTLPAGFRFLGCGTFGGCSSLAEISFPEGLVGIGECALEGTAIRELVLPEGPEDFWNVAPDCKFLARIVLPSTVKTMSHKVFAGYPVLREVTLPRRFEADRALYFPDGDAIGIVYV